MFKRGRYSGFIRPISYLIDLAIIYILAKQFFQVTEQFIYYIIFITVSWVIISMISNFYEIYRFTKGVKIVSLIAKQAVLFTLVVFAFFGFYNLDRTSIDISMYVIYVFSLIALIKLAIYYLLRKYRTLLGGNYRNVIIIGLNQKTDQLRKFFLDSPEYGYKLYKTFDLKIRKHLL